jgi:hypothetical protein
MIHRLPSPPENLKGFITCSGNIYNLFKFVFSSPILTQSFSEVEVEVEVQVLPSLVYSGGEAPQNFVSILGVVAKIWISNAKDVFTIHSN